MKMKQFQCCRDRSKNQIPWWLMSPGQWQKTVIRMLTRSSRHSKDHRRYAHRGPVKNEITILLAQVYFERSKLNDSHLSTRLTQRSVLPARSIEEPDGNIEPIVVHGPLMEDALAYEISLPVENRKYKLSDVL
jgi:hypothetical protein